MSSEFNIKIIRFFYAKLLPLNYMNYMTDHHTIIRWQKNRNKLLQ